MPYHGDELLVYRSDEGDSNIIQLTGYKTLYVRNTKYDRKGKKYYQVQRILSRELQNADCNQQSGVPPACYFIILAKVKDGLFLQVSFNEKLRGVFEADMSRGQPYSDTVVNGKKFNDIVVFKKYEDAETNGMTGVKQIIWSKSAGLVGYETVSGVSYSLR